MIRLSQHTTQSEVARACVQMLDLPDFARGGALLLNAGCGTGMCGTPIEERGYAWVGTDIALPMLQAAAPAASCAGLLQQDMGQRLPLRPGLFDGAISVAAVHWLLLPGAGLGLGCAVRPCLVPCLTGSATPAAA